MSEEKFDLPHASPVVPAMLTGDSPIQFQCHKGISCFNACCKNIDIQLTPYDILRLKKRLNISADEFLPKYTFPFEIDAHGLPGVKLAPVEGGSACQFMTDEGCSVYEDRPTSCRYYPLGLLSMRKKGASVDEQSYALVVEDHCKGHLEERSLTVDEYREEQGLKEYDDHTRGWRQLILKKKSAGPAIGKPSQLSLQLFFMASYHIDQFQKFVTSEQFLANYDLDPGQLEKLKTDQLGVIDFGVRFLKQVLFGEETVPVQADAARKREEHIKKRAQEAHEIARAQAELATKQAGKEGT